MLFNKNDWPIRKIDPWKKSPQQPNSTPGKIFTDPSRKKK